MTQKEILLEKPFNVALTYVMTLGEWYTHLIMTGVTVATERNIRKKYEVYAEYYFMLGSILDLMLASRRFSPDDLDTLRGKLSKISPDYYIHGFFRLSSIQREIGLMLAKANVVDMKPKSIKSDEVMSQTLK